MHLPSTLRSCVRLRPTITLRLPPPQLSHQAPLSFSSPKCNEVVVDQTKKNNNPNEDQTDKHKQDSKKPEKGDARYHEAIHTDPEEPTDATTGIKTVGQGTPAGQGERKKVHTETREKPGPHMTWGGDK